MVSRRPNPVTQLRRELAVKATEYAQAAEIPYYCSLGAPPVILFHAFGSGRHGNFLDRSYRAIQENPDWRRRLEKPHQRRDALPADWREKASELDSSTSSDALLMNIFCYPGILEHQPLAELLGVEATDAPEFGVEGHVPLGGGFDRTEVDMVLGSLHVEAKLTEADFTVKDLAHVQRYPGFAQVFDTAPLVTQDRSGKQQVKHYQLVRNILAIQAHKDNPKRFVLLIDQRRPDLADAWQEVMSAIKNPAVRARCRLLTWQQVAMRAPEEVKRFLREKYGILPAAYGFATAGTGSVDVTKANQALAQLYRDRINDLFGALRGTDGLSNPLLVQVPPAYGQARVRVMIVGQQTMEFEGLLAEGLGEDPVGQLMRVYADFALGIHYRSTPFWNAAHYVYEQLNPGAPEGGFVWSNLIKADQWGDRPEPKVEEDICRAFGVLPEEIGILQPDVVLFFTGPNYDDRLLRTFEGAELLPCEGCDLRALAQVKHAGLPPRSFRIYHPGYLRRSGQWGLLDKVLELCV